MANRNFLTSSNFQFITDLFGEEISYNIQSVNLPGVGFNHIEISKGSIKGRIQDDTLNFDMLSITFIIDEDLEIWKQMIKTLFIMRDVTDSTSQCVYKNGILLIKNQNSETKAKLEFKDLQIEKIGEVTFNTTESEDEFITCTVDLTYDYFTLI